MPGTHRRPRRLLIGLVPFVLWACAEAQPENGTAVIAHSGAVERTAEAGVSPLADEADPVVHVYKTPTCGCCADWVTHVEEAGFKTEVQDLPNLSGIRERLGVPRQLGSCHTALVGGYIVEGHVPAEVVQRLLREKPNLAGVAVPGMPMGSPGMEGPWTDPYDVIGFTADGGLHVYQSYR
jgi:hypothetical protein